MAEKRITVTVNGERHSAAVEPRLTLVDFLRDTLDLTGTHVGCEHGVCGACSVLYDDMPIRSCLMFAVQADGHRITTVEGLAEADGGLSLIQDCFWEAHGLQCGYCTPGMLIAAHALLQRNSDPSRQ
jgi:carbon-monoxide dehydrogenase small subunit